MIAKSLYAVTALAASLALPAAASAQAHAAHQPSKDIVQTAIDAGTFNTLVAAVKAAGLVETLKGKGPFTVFAPTDAAFAKLPAGTVESLLANPQKLASIPAAYSRPATYAPESRSGPREVCHQRFLCRQKRSAPASSSANARARFM